MAVFRGSERAGKRETLQFSLKNSPPLDKEITESAVMTQPSVVHCASAPAMPGAAPGAVRWVCTQNPFYVLSAGLFLAGLRISFGDPGQTEDAWALMSGLAGYTLLLAGTACLLVRFAKVWDDVRTVLLLVVLMFLATSVTFDEVLVLTPSRGFVCYLVERHRR